MDHDVARDQQRRVGDFLRTENRDAHRVSVFFVKRIDAERRGRRADGGFDVILNERLLLFLGRRLRGNGSRHQHRRENHKTSHHYLRQGFRKETKTYDRIPNTYKPYFEPSLDKAIEGYVYRF